MPLLFANPWGLLALAGIPVVLAIHFLHRHRKEIPVSTLFLIDIAREPARSGRRWHRLIPSIPMWLQLLLVILLTALLSQPYRPHGVLQVAVVIDDSASMSAFRDVLGKRLTALDQTTNANNSNTHWTILPSNPARARLYEGEHPAEWLNSIQSWSPIGGWRNPTTSLRLARDKVGPHGLVVYATDTPQSKLPSGVALLSLGRPINNVGIAGITAEANDNGYQWEAILVNPSHQSAERQWSLEWDGKQKTPLHNVSIIAGGMTTINGIIPENATRLVLRLNSDEFTLDDSYPFVRPSPKPLSMAILGEGVPPWLIDRLPRTIPRLSISPAAIADFALIGVKHDTAIPPSAGVVFSTDGETSAPYLATTAVPTSHPIVQGLSWAGLTVQDTPAPPPMPNDTVLIWSGERPLASLRMPVAKTANPDTSAPATDPPPAAPSYPPLGPQLVLHFNPELSNIDRLPAGAILLLRFAESVRAAKSATDWHQLEPGQPIFNLLPKTANGLVSVESLEATGASTATHPITSGERAPDELGFLRIRNGESILMEAAVAFADSRESDFRDCAAQDTTAEAINLAARDSRPTHNALLPILTILSLAALLLLYHFTGKSAQSSAGSTIQPSPTSSST